MTPSADDGFYEMKLLVDETGQDRRNSTNKTPVREWMCGSAATIHRESTNKDHDLLHMIIRQLLWQSRYELRTSVPPSNAALKAALRNYFLLRTKIDSPKKEVVFPEPSGIIPAIRGETSFNE